MSTVISLLGMLVAAGPVVPAPGGSQCPTAAEVAARVATLLTPGGRAGDPDIVAVRDDGAGLRLTLERPDGSIIGQRVLDAAHPCADLASAAAVIVATWESDVHPEFLQALPQVSTAAAPADASPPAVPVLPPALAPALPPGPELPPVTAARPPVVRAGSSSRLALDLGGGVFGSLAPGADSIGAAPGLLVHVALSPWGRGLGARLALLYPGERQVDLPPGLAQWRRVALALGPQVRFAAYVPGWSWDVHADALLAWVQVRGVGFSSNLSSTGWDPGLGVGLRLLMGGSTAAAPWVDLALAGWPRQQVVQLAEDPPGRPLPALEAQLAVGISFLAYP